MSDAAANPKVPMAKTQRLNLSAWLLLPILAVLAAGAFVVLGGFPGAELSPDILSTLARLPLLSLQAAAPLVIAAAFIHVNMYEPGIAVERMWFEQALAGDKNARWLLVFNTTKWFIAGGGLLAFFWPVR